MRKSERTEKSKFSCAQSWEDSSSLSSHRRESYLGRRSGILVKPLDGANPCLRRGDFVVAFRRGVIEETMDRVRPDMDLTRDIVFLQRLLIRRIGLDEGRVERAMVYEYRGFDFRH